MLGDISVGPLVLRRRVLSNDCRIHKPGILIPKDRPKNRRGMGQMKLEVSPAFLHDLAQAGNPEHVEIKDGTDLYTQRTTSLIDERIGIQGRTTWKLSGA